MKRDRSQSPELSKNIMQMRFMQRSREAEMRDKIREEKEQSFKEAQWVVNPNMGKHSAAGVVVVDEQSVMGTDLSLGRRSFKNFNHDIERVQREQEKQMRRAEKLVRKQESRAAEEERVRHEEALKDVSDADMVQRFQQMKQRGHVEGETRKRARDSSDSSDISDSEPDVKRQKVT
jgi:hypothetical protein